MKTRGKPDPAISFAPKPKPLVVEEAVQDVGARPSPPPASEKEKPTPTTGKPQNFSAFLTELFKSDHPRYFKQMKELQKDLTMRGYTEDDVRNALRHHYKYNEEAPNLGDWCTWKAYDMMVDAIKKWRDFERIRAANIAAAKELAGKEASEISYKAPERGQKFNNKKDNN